MIGADVQDLTVSLPGNEPFDLAGMSELPQPAGKALAVRAGGSQHPLFIVHDGNGNHGYAPLLASFIDQDIPVYVLPFAGSGETPLRTAAGMAARLRRMVRQVQTDGPYRIAGYGHGGILAYELAFQLIGEREQVDFLGLIDTVYFPLREDMAASITSIGILLDRVSREVERLSLKPDDLIMLRKRAEASDLASMIALCSAMGMLPDDLQTGDLPLIEAQLMRTRDLVAALEAGYATPAIPIPVHYFSAGDERSDDPLRGWQAVLRQEQIRLVRIPGMHANMMERPNVDVLGQALSVALRRGLTERVAIPEASYSPLVPLHFGREGAVPFFCVPGAGANVISFCDLVDALRLENPVYGMQPPGLEGQLVPHASVGAAAADYLSAITRISPGGPVHLIGHSFGGWVVLEMAHRLRESGREVASLTIIDSSVPNEHDEIVESSQSGALLELGEIFGQAAGQSLNLTRSGLEGLSEMGQCRLLHERLVKVGILSQRTTPALLSGPIRTFASCMRTSYVPPGPYKERLHLILLDDPKWDKAANEASFVRRRNAWKRFAPNLSCWHGSGNHMTGLMQPYVAVLAEWLKTRWQ